MADRRIRIAKDKAKLVKDLKASDDTSGPFQTYVDVLLFAAALGAKHNKRVPLVEFTKDLDPIRRDYFYQTKSELIINLLAASEIQNKQILANDEETDEQRLSLFEEYANGGLEILQQELRGAVDYSERVLLILSAERFQQAQKEEEFDLSKFLS